MRGISFIEKKSTMSRGGEWKISMRISDSSESSRN